MQRIIDVTFTYEESVNAVCLWKVWEVTEDGNTEHLIVLWEVLK